MSGSSFQVSGFRMIIMLKLGNCVRLPMVCNTELIRVPYVFKKAIESKRKCYDHTCLGYDNNKYTNINLLSLLHR